MRITLNRTQPHRQPLGLLAYFVTATSKAVNITNMPASRSKRPTTRTTANQSTLSFHNRSRVTKATATNDSDARKAQKKADAIELEDDVEPEVSEIVEEDEVNDDLDIQRTEEAVAKAEIQTTSVKTSPSVLKSTPKSKSKSSSKPANDAAAATIDVQASKITDAQLKKYWQAEEDVRLAPRGKSASSIFMTLISPLTTFHSLSASIDTLPVHQSHLPLPEKILRHFDLSSQYGPCIGISRLSRFRRAHAMDLEPPIEVLAVLLREEEKDAKSTGLKGKGGAGRQCGKMAYIDELGGGKVVLVE